MGLRQRMYVGAAIGVGMFTISIASATAVEPETKTAQTKVSKADLGSTLGTESQLTLREQLSQGKDYLEKMNTVAKKVKDHADESRESRDMIKLECVYNKLPPIRGTITLSEKAYSTLQSAALRNDKSVADYAFTKLTVAYQKVSVLGQEAEACVGEELAFIGETQVRVTFTGETYFKNPTNAPSIFDAGGNVGERNPVASPTQ